MQWEPNINASNNNIDGKYTMLGLSYDNINASYDSISYAFYLYNFNSLRIYEKGILISSHGNILQNDIFKIERVGNQIKYWKNATLLRTVIEPIGLSGQPLVADGSLHTGTRIRYVYITTPLVTSNTVMQGPDCQILSNDTEVNGLADIQDNVIDRILGKKKYELSNHLGNVLTTISDRLIPMPDATTPTDVSHYNADVIAISDYYPFGMVMPGRSFTSESYRFGFQGQEKNSDFSGVDGGHLDFSYRIYDARLGRFLAIDPLFASYPWNSPYAFSENRVIDGIDLEGLEFLKKVKPNGVTGLVVKLEMVNSAGINKKLVKALKDGLKTTFKNLLDVEGYSGRIKFKKNAKLNFNLVTAIPAGLNGGAGTQVDRIGGENVYFLIGKECSDCNSENIPDNFIVRENKILKNDIVDKDIVSGAHEIFHLGGLNHLDRKIDESGKFQQASDVSLLYDQASEGDESAIESLSNNIMNEGNGTVPIPRESTKPSDQKITKGQIGTIIKNIDDEKLAK